MTARDALMMAKRAHLSHTDTLAWVWLNELSRKMADGKRVVWRSVGTRGTPENRREPHPKSLIELTDISERGWRKAFTNLHSIGFLEDYSGDLFAANGEVYQAAKGVNVFEVSQDPAATLTARRERQERRRMNQVAKDVPKRVEAARAAAKGAA